MKRRLRLLCAVAAALAALGLSVARAAGPEETILPVPHRSQVDGTIWSGSNCGPASLAMVLEAFGDRVSNVSLRERANQLLGVSSPRTGTKIEHLARITSERGLAVIGPMQGKEYRRWTIDEARAEIRDGRPLLVQVWLPLLPNHKRNPVPTDHYIVLVGAAGDGFVYNDPADSRGPGFRQKMTEEQLARAWRSSGAPYAAFSVGPGAAGAPLLTPPPAPEPLLAAPVEPEPPQATEESVPELAEAEILSAIPSSSEAAGGRELAVAPTADDQPVPVAADGPAPAASDQPASAASDLPAPEGRFPALPLAAGLVAVLIAGVWLFRPDSRPERITP